MAGITYGFALIKGNGRGLQREQKMCERLSFNETSFSLNLAESVMFANV